MLLCMRYIILIHIILAILLHYVSSAVYFNQLGSSLCSYLESYEQLPSHLIGQCGLPICSSSSSSINSNNNTYNTKNGSVDISITNHNGLYTDSTQPNTHTDRVDDHNSDSEPYRVVLSYGHNGLGNQIYQHSFAYSVAKSLKAKLYLQVIPPELYVGKILIAIRVM